MKKVFYDSRLAKMILFAGYSTITIMAWVFTKKKESEMKQSVINHECTHARQWIELTVASGLLLWIGMLLFGYSAWWLASATVTFYAWYGIEWLFRIMLLSVLADPCNKDSLSHQAYRNVSFEQEARMAEGDNNYLENSNYFGWLRFLK